MPQLLIELFSEEIPARMQIGAARDFERMFGDKLHMAGFDALSVNGSIPFKPKAYVGPRRLTLVVENLPLQQAATSDEIKGPKLSAPAQAIDGFLRKVGLSKEELSERDGIWVARVEKPARSTTEILTEILRDVILSFPWPKSMRSGVSSFRWVRPLKRILFLFDGQVVPFELEGLTASNLTEGHRFLGSGQSFVVSDFTSYQKGLSDNSVILDHEARQAVILEKARAVCAEAGCELMDDQGLLEEVAGLNEWPVPVLGDMDPQFLTLPPEVIKTSMRTHQKYFAVRDAKTGKMAAKFVIVANMQATDGGIEIKRGNAKVLSARLSDGVFFWNEDNKPGNFDGWLERLKGTTFHVKLGTMAQRVERIVALAKHIAPLLKADAATAVEAARLAKADLASKMVGEFPELQGVMGGYYADALKLSAEVANAIREHYKPQGPSDSVPESAVSATVALADKIDTLVGFFAIDERPTGSKDPYALRRAALGILRILREHDARLSIGELVQAWYAHLGGDVPAHFRPYESVRSEILDFFNDRLKVQLKEEGQRFDVLDAVLAEKDDDIVRVTLKVAATDAALVEFGDDLVAVHKRAANILAAESKKGALPEGEPQVTDGAPAIESDLISELKVQKNNATGFLAQENYIEVLKSVAAMRQTVDAFLDGVLVNADDSAVRANRLLILKAVCDLSAPVADLSKIV